MATKASCSVEDCDRPQHSRTYCYPHYFRWYRNGDPGPAEIKVKNPGRVCSADSCSKRAAGRGLCSTHYARWRRHGDAATVKSPAPQVGEGNWRWTADEASYNAVHMRLRAQRGAATTHQCKCGKPAAQWSYDHADPNGRKSKEGPYSTDLNHYTARCVPCHKRSDLERIRASVASA